MDEDYTEEMRKFYRKYWPLRKEFNLRMKSHFDNYGNNRIELWECRGYREERCACRIVEKSAEACYRKAASMLDIFEWRREGRYGEQEKTG